MGLIYSFAIACYACLIYLAAPFNAKAKLWIAGRKSLPQLPKNVKKNPLQKRIWFHCASLGEYEQAIPVIKAYKEQETDCFVLVSFFSPSGYTNYKPNNLVDYVFYLPIDFPNNMDKLLIELKPNLVVFVKYEIWHTLIAKLSAQKIPTYLIAAHFRRDQIYFKPWGSWFRKSLHRFTHIFVQEQGSIDLLKTIGVNHCSISGDTRIDKVMANKLERVALPLIESFVKGSKTIVLGSAWQAEVILLAKYLENNSFQGKVIIAPHEIDAQNIEKLEKILQKNHVRYSQFQTESSEHQDCQILLIDSIGLLKHLYAYGDLALIGGAFGKGLHNILEAITFGIPVIFGPKHQRFPEAQLLIENDCAFSVTNQAEFDRLVNQLFSDSIKLLDIKKNTATYLTENKGAAERIVNKITTSTT